MLKGLCIALIVVFLYLQYQVWLGSTGYFTRKAVIQDQEQIESKLMILRAKSRLITNQIKELRRSPDPIESHARTRLGMIKSGEIFLIVPEEDY